ncbi:MAG: metallophosphoesterase [Verrucomicrobiota bacterium]|nr:metallophosphoesterase [Verrucomicrobiota bacterium]
MEARLIAIGDIHGCAWEFEQLLSHLQPGPQDQVVLLGDLVNRGPDSHRVLKLARECRAISLLGNHERRLLNFLRLGNSLDLKTYDRYTIDELTDEDWDYISHMRLTHYSFTHDTVFVHAGFLPNIPWQKQTVSIVTEIQVVDNEGQPRKRSESPNSPHWCELWKGPPFVVYGHTPRKTTLMKEWSLGLDTACVNGGFLSAYVLPEKKIYQVKAKRAYVPIPL